MSIAAMALGYMAQDKAKKAPKKVSTAPAKPKVRGMTRATIDRLKRLEDVITYEPQRLSDFYEKLGYGSSNGDSRRQKLRDDIRALRKLKRIRTIKFNRECWFMSPDNKMTYCSNSLQQKIAELLDGKTSMSQISDRLNQSRSTIRHSVNAMLDSKLIKLVDKDGSHLLYKMVVATGLIQNDKTKN